MLDFNPSCPVLIRGAKTMKLICDFEMVDMGTEIIAVPVGGKADQVHCVIKLNESGRIILELLTKGTTEEQILNMLCNKYRNDREELEQYIRDVVLLLNSYGVIE